VPFDQQLSESVYKMNKDRGSTILLPCDLASAFAGRRGAE
jgi:hypothetical protein